MRPKKRKSEAPRGAQDVIVASENETARFWGWGTLDRSFDEEKAKRFITTLTRERGLRPTEEIIKPLALSDFKMPRSRLPEAFQRDWEPRGLSTERLDRLIHAAGKSYRDLVRLRTGTLKSFPDGVIHLRTREDLCALFADAVKYGVSLVPFGGGTGVVGGTECLGRAGQPVVVIDLKKLNKLISFDEESLIATFEAGILGPDLEQILQARGYTLGHFPQSFEYSTLGGWVATRSAGQNSTKYGKIEDRVSALEIMSPRGSLHTHLVPASATGPSLKQILIGSEGIYGIITSVTVRVAPLPDTQEFIQAFFPDFWGAVSAIRKIMQAGLRPGILRLSDDEETDLLSHMVAHGALKSRLLALWKTIKRLGPRPCFLLMGFEGATDEVRLDAQRARALLRANRGAMLHAGMSENWQKDRFIMPFLRDNLMDAGYFIDTLETAAPWSCLEGLHHAMQQEFDPVKFGEKLVVGCHLSHAYTDGASLYFTFIGRQKSGDEIGQWERIKKTATDVLMAHGGALSHHHGIGYDHSRWMKTEAGDLGLNIFRSIKRELDPAGCLNPGKLVEME